MGLHHLKDSCGPVRKLALAVTLLLIIMVSDCFVVHRVQNFPSIRQWEVSKHVRIAACTSVLKTNVDVHVAITSVGVRRLR